MSERYTGNPPPWAVALVEKYAPGMSLRWRRSAVKPKTTAQCRGGDIVVTQGTGSADDSLRVIVLHEIAHRDRLGHDAVFYRRFWRLLTAESLYCHSFEVNPRYGPALKRAARAAAGLA